MAVRFYAQAHHLSTNRRARLHDVVASASPRPAGEGKGEGETVLRSDGHRMTKATCLPLLWPCALLSSLPFSLTPALSRWARENGRPLLCASSPPLNEQAGSASRRGDERLPSPSGRGKG